MLLPIAHGAQEPEEFFEHNTFAFEQQMRAPLAVVLPTIKQITILAGAELLPCLVGVVDNEFLELFFVKSKCSYTCEIDRYACMDENLNKRTYINTMVRCWACTVPVE